MKYMLFSATFPKAARELAGEYLAANHVRFRVGRAGSSHENIRQVVLAVEHFEKKQTLLAQLKSLPPCRTIVFVNSKRTADELDDFLFNMGLPCTSMHADRTQLEREASMRAFRAGKSPILIATGVSSRGIDVRNVLHVINYDLPSMEHGGIEEYTHRIGTRQAPLTNEAVSLTHIGRTGRAGHRGLATSFFTDRDEQIASVLTRTLLETNQEIPDFLSHHVPQDGVLMWESEEQEVEASENANGGGFWGATGDDMGAGNLPSPEPAAVDSWGAADKKGGWAGDDAVAVW